MKKPEYPSRVGNEKELLDAHLDFARSTLVYKASGLDDVLAKKRLGKTATSVLGVVKHMANVENSWFLYNFAGVECDFDWGKGKPNGDYEILDSESSELLIARYVEACAKSREVCLGKGLDDVSAMVGRDGNHTALRWIYLHMIDETARHNGQLDIYRELLDGQVDCIFDE